LIKYCNLLIPRPPQRTFKLEEKPSSLKREHPALLLCVQARAQRLENAVNVQQLVASVEAGKKRRIGEVLEDTDLETEFLRWYINPS
jgi:hypothetical protein